MEVEVVPPPFFPPARQGTNIRQEPPHAEADVALSKSTDEEFIKKLDSFSLESIVEFKISRFLDQVGTYFPENMHDLIVRKIEKPLIHQVLRRTGGNQVHSAKILGINRNTLRKKMKMYGL